MGCDCPCCRVYGPIPDLDAEKENFKAVIKMAKLKEKRRKKRKWNLKKDSKK